MARLVFTEDPHEYHLDGVRIPSVTEIIGMLTDFSFVPKDVLERASTFGRAVHKAIELYENDDLDESMLSLPLVPYLDQYKRFVSETGFTATHTEERVYSERYRYAGTLDLAGMLNHQDAIIDTKTVSVLHPAVGLQTAAYDHAFCEMHGLKKRKRRFALQLSDTRYRLVEYKDQHDFTYFAAALSLHTWRKNNGQ